MSQRYFIRLAYDGTGFHGWQRQPNSVTVQQSLEDAMTMMLGTRIVLTGAGRTDTGVHAACFFAHFDLTGSLSDHECRSLVHHLNGYLKDAIAVERIIPVGQQFHARYSALSRTYRYCIARKHNPFRVRYTWFLNAPVDTDLMNQGAGILVGCDDFTSFSKVDTDTKTNFCKVMEAGWCQEGTELVFTIKADRFLRNMVRAVVGTLIDLGTGKIGTGDFNRIIENKDRSGAGQSVPARGLILQSIEYPQEAGLGG